MRIIALIEEADVVERILKHLEVRDPIPDIPSPAGPDPPSATAPCVALGSGLLLRSTSSIPGLAKLFKHGRSQAVRLPKAFRLPGDEVRVRRVGRGVLLEPLDHSKEDIAATFTEIDRIGGHDFLREGRPTQPPLPPEVAFDE